MRGSGRRTEHADKRLQYNMVQRYVGTLVDYARLKIAVALCLLVFVGLMEGLGLLLLVPFLHLIGPAQAGGAPTGFAAVVTQVFATVGLPLTLPTILCVYVGVVTFHAILLRWHQILLTDIRFGFVDHLRTRLYKAIGRAN